MSTNENKPPRFPWVWASLAIVIVVLFVCATTRQILTFEPNAAGVEASPPQYLIPFPNGDCYRLDDGWVVVQVEVGRKDGVKLLWLKGRPVTLFPILAGELPRVEGNTIFCPIPTLPWPEHLPAK